jgi:hypothetical protein
MEYLQPSLIFEAVSAIQKNSELLSSAACPYRKSNPLAVDRESGDAAARC